MRWLLALVLLCVPGAALASDAAESGQISSPSSPSDSAFQPAVDEITRLNRRGGELFGVGAESDGLFVLRTALRRAVQSFGNEHPVSLIVAANYWQCLDRRGKGLLEKQSHREIKDLTEIRPLVEEMRRIDREFPSRSDPQAIDTLSGHAQSLVELGELREAERMLQEAWRLNDAVRGSSDLATLAAKGKFALVYGQLGQGVEALQLIGEVLDEQREKLGPRHPATLASLSNYAATLRGLRRYVEAADIETEVLRLRRDVLGAQDVRTLQSQASLVSDLAALGRPARALVQADEVLSLRAQILGLVHRDTLLSLADKGAILNDLGQYEQSEPIFAELYKYWLTDAGESHPETLRTLVEYAAAMRGLGRLEEAEPLINKSRDLSRASLGPEHPRTLQRYLDYAGIVLDLGEPARAARLASDILQAYRRRASLQSGSGVVSAGLRDRERGTLQSAEKLYADALWQQVAAQGTDSSSANTSAFDLRPFALRALQMGSAGSASRALARAAAMRFADEAGMGSLVDEREELQERWRNLQAMSVSRQSQSEGGDPAIAGALSRQIEATGQRLAEIDAQLRRDAPQYFSIVGDGAQSLDEVREVLGDDEAILFLVPTARGTHLMAVTQEAFAWERSERDEIAIRDAVEELRFGLEIQAGDAFLPAFDLALGHELYTDLIAPVEQALAGKSRVFVVAGGALSRLPLGTLVASPVAPGANPDDAETLRSADWLADRYALVQLPSFQSLVYIRNFGVTGGEDGTPGFAGFGAPVLEGEAQLRSARSATLAATDAASFIGAVRGARERPLMNPDALRQLTALPGTLTELEQVREALGAEPASLFLADRMTEQAIRQADLSATRILHLATHGFTSEESGVSAEPGLVFTPPAEATPQDDGYLAASEVLSLNLTSAQWVILSACNTASPSGQTDETGLSGLAQAFFYAGAESLLVSHWPVFDDIAPILTVDVLRRSQAGEPKAEALQAAIRTVRTSPQLNAAHPAVWAAFTLVGEGR